MIAAYDAQFAEPSPTQATAPAAPQGEVKTDPPADPKEGEQPTKDPKDDEVPKTPKDGETPPTSLADLVDSGDFFNGIVAEKVPENIAEALKAAGLKPEQIAGLSERLRGLVAAEATLATQALHKAAGGEAEFNALVAWGKTNLTPEQREFYDAQLNGPNAAEVIELLKVKASKGADPKLIQGNGAVPAATQGYRSQAEMQRDMRDPRYQTDPAFRADVRNKLKYATY